MTIFILAMCAVATFAINCAAYDAPSSIPVEPDHCLGDIWQRGKEIDLAAMLNPSCGPFMNDLYFEANGERCTGNKLRHSFYCPGPLKPDIYYVALRHRNIDRPLDVMWIVVNSPMTKAEFDAWFEANTNTAWTAALPRPFASIAVTNGVATDPEPPSPDGGPGLWDAPHKIDPTSYLHHNAVWEMRTTIDGEHGNQATYDAQGNLIRTTIAAGTADWCAPYGPDGSAHANFGHVTADVRPYIQALQLDGNPVRVTGVSVWFPFAFSRPCLHQGAYTDKYLQCRPTILP